MICGQATDEDVAEVNALARSARKRRRRLVGLLLGTLLGVAFGDLEGELLDDFPRCLG